VGELVEVAGLEQALFTGDGFDGGEAPLDVGDGFGCGVHCGLLAALRLPLIGKSSIARSAIGLRLA
jgi:hypothetical protein